MKAQRAPKAAPVRGMQDFLGEQAERFDHVVAVFRDVGRRFGFRPVMVPVVEATSVFARTLGETTDVVSKEMYSFPDRGGDSLTLRPEFTAGIARAYVSEGWQQYAPLKLVTHGPLFRYERPQKGRYRQFHQIDAEVIGAAEPAADVEVIAFADLLLKELGVQGVTLQLNTLGDAETRSAWRDALVAHFSAHRDVLSEDSRRRLAINPLRILDSKEAADRALVADAPVIDDFLSAEAGAFFEDVQKGLRASGVAWTRAARLVRGFDYYRHTAFEFVSDALGAQATVIGGGRYDGLIETMGGPPTPAVGWAGGIERLMMLHKQLGGTVPLHVEVAVIPEDASSQDAAKRLVQFIRLGGDAAELFWNANSRKAKERATRKGASHCVFVSTLGDGRTIATKGEVMQRDLISDFQYRDLLQAALKNAFGQARVIENARTGVIIWASVGTR